MSRTKKTKPPMQMLPIYVQYVYKRRCRRNPSYERFTALPSLDQNFLWKRWRERREKKR